MSIHRNKARVNELCETNDEWPDSDLSRKSSIIPCHCPSCRLSAEKLAIDYSWTEETRRAYSNALSRLDVEGEIMKNYWTGLRRVVKIFSMILTTKNILVNSELKDFPHEHHR